jgi:polar amino acid transport system permease protein
MKSSFPTLLIERPGTPPSPWLKGTWLALILITASLLCALVMGGAAGVTQGGWDAVWKFRGVFWRGWLLTILISFLSLILSTLIGGIVALARRSRILPLRSAALLYVEVIRGTPLLAQILFLFYVVANGIGLQDRLVAGILILSLFSGAYLSEMIRAGIESVPASQLESARAIGLTTLQTYRFVIAPQALRQILPPLAGQFASLIKDSSLLSIIGIGEFTLAAQQVNSATYRTLESYLPLAIGYLALTLPISLLSKMLEKRLRYEA